MPKVNICHDKDQIHKLYGSALVGLRGQVVIPAQARKDMDLKPGDRVVVVGGLGKALGLMKSQDLEILMKKLIKGINLK
jgi:AbrB family looped-hinge helix DNA binding protein